MGKRWAAVLLAAMLMLSAAACMAPESGPPSAVSSADSADSAQGTAAPDDSASVPDAPTTAPADPEASDSAENAEKNDLTMPTITDEQRPRGLRMRCLSAIPVCRGWCCTPAWKRT